MVVCLVGLVLLSAISTQVTALPSGAPASVCGTLSPAHFAAPQAKNTSPFAVRAALDLIRATSGDGVIVVTIDGSGSKKSENQMPMQPQLFKGFVIQARMASNQSKSEDSNSEEATILVDGTFTPDEGSRPITRTFSCGLGRNSHNQNTWTHSSPLGKQRVSALWTPPNGFTGSVVFRATVVASVDTFWEHELSDPVQIVARSESAGDSAISTLPEKANSAAAAVFKPSKFPMESPKNLLDLFPAINTASQYGPAKSEEAVVELDPAEVAVEVVKDEEGPSKGSASKVEIAAENEAETDEELDEEEEEKKLEQKLLGELAEELGAKLQSHLDQQEEKVKIATAKDQKDQKVAIVAAAEADKPSKVVEPVEPSQKSSEGEEKEGKGKQ